MFLIPVAGWAAARWQVDEWRFLQTVLGYEFAAHSPRASENHHGGWFYYLNILAKHHYEWLVAGLVALACCPVRRFRAAAWLRRDVDRYGTAGVLLCYGVITWLVPTLMRTKLPWYLNPFYPVFAMGIGWIVARGLTRASATDRTRMRAALVGVLVLALGVAEGKLVWYSFHHRDLGGSPQGLLMAGGDAIAGRRVLRSQWDRAEIFVIRDVLRAERGMSIDADDFIAKSDPGDYYVTSHDIVHPELSLVRSNRRYRLYERLDAPLTQRGGRLDPPALEVVPRG